MKAFYVVSATLLAFALISSAGAQRPTPIPTLAVPTLVPRQADVDPPASQAAASSVADIIESGAFRVGVLYNEPPYSEFTLQGDLRGFDIDLIRLIVELWGSDVEFIQVTRENALDRLNRGQVHAIATAFVRYRDLDTHLGFSQTYLVGRQAMMIRADSPYQALSELGGHGIGYVIGTRAEKALSLWSARLGSSLNLQVFLTLDRAFAALTDGRIEGLVAEEQALLRAAADYADRVRILDEAVLREPRAIAVRPHDIAFRHLLSHSIQSLVKDGSLLHLYREYFPENENAEEAVKLWDGIGEAVSPTQYAGALASPTRDALSQMRQSGLLRAGLAGDGAQAASAGKAQLASLGEALLHEFGRRWGVAVEIVTGSPEEARSMLTQGEVDIVAGMKPDWRLAASMDFSAPYLLHGDRLMAPAHSRIQGFNDLRGRIIGVILGDEGARDRAQAWADSINASVRFFQTREDNAALHLLEFNNANAIYADSLLLVSHLQASPNDLRLTDRWYSQSYYAFGLPYNDREFRLLVDYSIQELVRDGTLRRLSGALILSDELPDFEITPGAANFAGINLSGF
ncbi:MAG: transporter substrate-binding domain-containing protein [Chloroflexi bacterium]|nr:transporter substrate-binding domain-containing protein [Chloroflexota bacterium]